VISKSLTGLSHGRRGGERRCKPTGRSEAYRSPPLSPSPLRGGEGKLGEAL
jgi:hypothetical protein